MNSRRWIIFEELYSQISAARIEHVIHTNVYSEVVFLGSIVLHYTLMYIFYNLKSVGVCMITVLAQFSILRYISGIIGHKEGYKTIYHTLHRSVRKPVLQSKPRPKLWMPSSRNLYKCTSSLLHVLHQHLQVRLLSLLKRSVINV